MKTTFGHPEVGEAQQPGQMIRTVNQLEELDPDAMVLDSDGMLWGGSEITDISRMTAQQEKSWVLPVVIVCTGTQVRAAQEALKKERK